MSALKNPMTMMTYTDKSNMIVTGKADSYTDKVRNEEVSSFKFLRVTLSKDGNSTTDINIRMATASATALVTAAVARLNNHSIRL